MSAPLAFLWLLAAPAHADCSKLPDWPIIERPDNYFNDWDELKAMNERSYHCAQPRLTDHWDPLPGGGAAAVNERGSRPNHVRVKLRVPQTFIDSTIAHIDAMMKQGRARYIFFADLNHNHMHISKKAFRRYEADWDAGRWAELLEGVMADPELKSVYHSQELLRHPKDPPREFLAHYGAQPSIEPLDMLPLESQQAVRADTQSVFGIVLRSHPKGAYALADGTRFDISFQDDGWDAGYREIGVRVTRPADPPSDQ